MAVTNRLKNFDSDKSWYFVTIYTQGGQKYFGNIINNKMIINKHGQIIKKYWLEISKHFFNVKLDEFIIMPNHVHGIIVIQNPNQYVEAGLSRLFWPSCPILDQAIGYFKYQSTKYINGFMKVPENKIIQIFQRSYYEHIIRNKNEFNRIRQYIENNPINWDEDKNDIQEGGEILNG